MLRQQSSTILLMLRMRQLGLGLYLIGALAFAQSDGDAAALYSGADVVFTGQLETVAPSPTGLRARFNVTKLIKGREAVENELLAQLPAESRCHALEERHSYLIYGRSIGDQLWIDPCEGSKLVSLAEADLRYIHKVNPKISEQCNRERLAQLARSSRVVATAEVLSTEDSLGTSTLPFRPWCGLTLTTEDAHYHVVEVLKGEVNDPKITVEHAICWDTVTVDGYSPALSSEIVQERQHVAAVSQAQLTHGEQAGSGAIPFRL
jgi:hypothetical protein